MLKPATDYTYFKGLVDRTAKTGFQMKEVSADKGYLGASNILATLQHGAIPYIPFKSNSDSRGQAQSHIKRIKARDRATLLKLGALKPRKPKQITAADESPSK